MLAHGNLTKCIMLRVVAFITAIHGTGGTLTEMDLKSPSSGCIILLESEPIVVLSIKQLPFCIKQNVVIMKLQGRRCKLNFDASCVQMRGIIHFLWHVLNPVVGGSGCRDRRKR